MIIEKIDDNRLLIDKIPDVFVIDNTPITIETIRYRLDNKYSLSEIKIAVQVLCENIKLLNKTAIESVEHYSLNTEKFSQIVDSIYRAFGVEPEEIEKGD